MVWGLILQIDFLPAYSCSGGSYKAWKKSYPKMVSSVSSFFFSTSAWCQLGWMSCLRLGLLTVTTGSSFMNNIPSWTRGEKVCVRGRLQNLTNQRTLACQWFIPTSNKKKKKITKKAKPQSFCCREVKYYCISGQFSLSYTHQINVDLGEGSFFISNSWAVFKLKQKSCLNKGTISTSDTSF